MKIEAGKYYRTRDGLKVFIGIKRPTDCPGDAYPFIGWCEDDDGEWRDHSWTEDGKFLESHPHDGHDLIAEWPLTYEIRLILWSSGNWTAGCDRKPPCQPGELGRQIACKVVTITEGEGMNESKDAPQR